MKNRTTWACLLLLGSLIGSSVTLLPGQQPEPIPAPKPVEQQGVNVKTGKPFPRGAHRSPAHKILEAPKFVPPKRNGTAPSQVAYTPTKLDMWGNDQYGDCVSAEEAFAKATGVIVHGQTIAEMFIPTATVTQWASQHGYLNGADLAEVLDSMTSDGFRVGSQQYNNGPKQSVDYSNEAVLQAAIAEGPVKIAIDANALPSGAGNRQGWTAFGKGRFPNTDHCVALAGYGPVPWLCTQLHVQPPANAPATGYLLYTWSTIGIVDHDWLMGTCVEAWVRSPTSTGVPPLPAPGPGPTTAPATTTLTQTATAGTLFSVRNASGAEVGKLGMTSTAAPGAYPSTTGTATYGTVTFAVAQPAGTVLTFPNLGTMTLSAPVNVGDTLNLVLP